MLSPFTKRAFSEEDKHVIRFLRLNKHYGAKRVLKEFLHKSYSRAGLCNIIRMIERTGISKRLPGSGRPPRTADNIGAVETLALSQEDLPQTHRTQRQIAREVGTRILGCSDDNGNFFLFPQHG